MLRYSGQSAFRYARADCSGIQAQHCVRWVNGGVGYRQEMEFEESGIGEECGVFGCVAAGEWPSQLEVAQILTLGLVALQHR